MYLTMISEMLRALWKQQLRLRLVATLAGLAGAQPVSAMTFTVESAGPDRRVVVARGVIEAGDAERLQRALQAANRDASGNKLLVLDSPGGAIVEAFAMVDVMDAERVSTRVRAGASCASSCAMILFVSGAFRTVEEGGRLGVHACYDAASKSRSSACNELIAQNALKRGVPYESSLALMHFTAAGEMRWLDASGAACWKLSRGEPATENRPAPEPGSAACPTPAASGRVNR
jgi:hypothetical protein